MTEAQTLAEKQICHVYRDPNSVFEDEQDSPAINQTDSKNTIQASSPRLPSEVPAEISCLEKSLILSSSKFCHGTKSIHSEFASYGIKKSTNIERIFKSDAKYEGSLKSACINPQLIKFENNPNSRGRIPLKNVSNVTDSTRETSRQKSQKSWKETVENTVITNRVILNLSSILG